MNMKIIPVDSEWIIHNERNEAVCSCESEEAAVKVVAVAMALVTNSMSKLNQRLDIIKRNDSNWQTRHLETHKAMLNFIREIKELAQ